MRQDNKIVHGMWFGTALSRLELLTIHSFVRFGHEFHLWAYDDLSAYEFPKGCVVRDAEQIIPRKAVFAKSGRDAETGVGRGSFGAPFSDLFRYKLLMRHGGIWVDMDVTCLRPFDFPGEYAFRPHRIGVVGSILKCPPNSALMRRVHGETARCVTPESDYLLPNRILTKHVEALGLQSFIVDHMSNADHWMEFIRPLIEGMAELPRDWYAIHWINEMWRTLEADRGQYRDRPLLDYVPDKDRPRPGSLLWELYRFYGLLDPQEIPPETKSLRTKLGKPLPPRQPLTDKVHTTGHLNVLLPSLVRGGAEHSVVETLGALRHDEKLRQTLFVVHRSRQQYPLRSGENLRVVFADEPDDTQRSMRAFALDMWEKSTPRVYTHLIASNALRVLWDMGIQTIPVIQNMSPGWTDRAEAYDVPSVPFVVGVSDAVSEELRASGMKKPVITLRHEIQRHYSLTELARFRREIRDRYDIADGTMIIGMVGQFKSQKAYTRAVRVLAEIRRHFPAKLIIIGGWDHAYGQGRAAYEATCRRAVELGVIADMIMPGDTYPVEPYLAAFDVFLNTSIYEGLSVAMLEAIATGCPVVSADAGGNREALPENAVLVRDGSDIDAYVRGIIAVTGRSQRVVPASPPDPTFVPRLWYLLAKHGVENSLPGRDAPSGTMFLTETLEIGGPQTSLVNLLAEWKAPAKKAVCVLRGVLNALHKRKLDDAQIPILSADTTVALPDKIEFALHWIDRLNVANVCFWNVAPEVKLALTKILMLRAVRIIDVSPGQMLFDELEAAASFQNRVSLSAAQYFDRLDAFVEKFKREALIPADLQGKLRVIRNGVKEPPAFVPLPPHNCTLPAELDSELAIGTCCRVVPDKRLEFLLETMKTVQIALPGASLTIVGGTDQQSRDYFDAIRKIVDDGGVKNVFLTGWQDDALPFLAQYRVFLMVADRQGCPNASLEAMSLGVPVVANRSGGTAEQVKEGATGYLVDTPEQMAGRVVALLKDRKLRAKMGRAAREHVRKVFPMKTMVAEYARLLGE